MPDTEVSPPYEDTMMEIFDRSVQECLKEYPSQRLGQASYNTLYPIRKSWTNEIHGTDLDPFNLDERVPAFRVWLKAKFRAEWETFGEVKQ